MYSIQKLVKDIFIQLDQQSKTLCVAESCTGGFISHYLTNQEGSSRYFVGGITTYTDSLKINILQIPEEVVQKNQAVTEDVAKYMAYSVKSLLNGDWSLSITGFLGLSEPERGRVFVGVSGPKTNVVTTAVVAGSNRNELKKQAAHLSLNFLLSNLNQQSIKGESP